ncbi:hypothetical protein [Williamsia phyllosphaerae]|uniref:Integral membrane protein n=1 Tax=Williamsia phyllosphaerae TaxID=885042 RepID=A0ABQ1V8G5_9NOCA|nr:hypothetical protein [Williamsia phyllosphaerae]GGF40870.1 hypothetical protein GCM10007298_40750 [Williamsia phyllosphaerae]
MESPVLLVIIGCEIGFWVVVFAGLAVRYGLRAPRASTIILRMVPVVDVVLLVAVALDLHSGAAVEQIHRIAGVYLGVTVAFGHSMIRWADVRCAHWFFGGPAPTPRPKRGPEAVRQEVIGFARWLLAAGVAGAAILGLAVTVADSDQAHDLYGIFPLLGIITVIWFATGPAWAWFDQGSRVRS